MRLADFILSNTPAVLAEWDIFARSVWPHSDAALLDLRDHAEEILRATARDMKTVQSATEQEDKSKGAGVPDAPSVRLTNASERHAEGRVNSGFDLTAMMAEYRALRASVIRLWVESKPTADKNDLADITRFNEAIDQSLSEAVCRYSEKIEQSRQMFLGILGHDLRNPLNAIALGAASISEAPGDEATCAEGAAQIESSAKAMSEMLNDFLDYAASNLGHPMPVSLAPMDLHLLCSEVLSEMQRAFPDQSFRLSQSGDLKGKWDVKRLRQLFSNLISNAVQHGRNTAVSVVLTGQTSDVTFTVHNGGPPIAAGALRRIFDPLVRGQNAGHRVGSLGLGLYIAREVVAAHGGAIEVSSSGESGTLFSVQLPRDAAMNPRRALQHKTTS